MKRVLLFTFLLCGVSAVGAEPWSLERCIEHAEQHNIQVRQGATDVRLSELSVQQSKWDYSPSLGANASYSANFGRSLDPTTYNFVNNQSVNNVNGSVSLSTQLFGGMRKLHTLKQAEFNLRASVQDVEKIKNEVTLSVAAAYLQILYNREQIINSESQIATLDDQVTRTRKLVDAGSSPMGALLDLESQRASEQYNLVSYRNTYDLAVLTLTQLLELRGAGADDFAVEVPVLDDLKKIDSHSTLDDIYSLALSLPQIEAAKLRLDAADRGVDLARSRYYPTLDAGAQFGSSFSDARQKPQLGADGQTYYDKYPFFDQLGDNSSSAIQISLNIPIFSGLTTRRNVGVAKVRKLQSQLALALTEDQLYKEIGQALSDASGALERFRAAESSVAAAMESFAYATTKFSAGATNSVDYNTAKNNLIAAESMRTQAKYEYIFKTKILDFYKGIPIKL